MASQAEKSKQSVCENIRELVSQIRSWDGSSGNEEIFWRENQQHLLRILADNPLELYSMDPEMKEGVKSIVDSYLHWSFNGYF